MKKCPKCGTILDDSKKKCYMCGTNLSLSTSVSDFSSNFNDEIGSSVSKGSDNVFNNGKDIDIDSRDIVDGDINNNGSFFSHNSSSRDYFGGEINKLNSEGVRKSGKFSKRKEERTKDKFFSKPKEEPVTISNERIPQNMMESIIEKNTESRIKKQEFTAPVEENRTIKSNIIMEEKRKEEALPDAFKSFNSFNDEKTLERTKELKKTNDFFSFDSSNNKNNSNSNTNTSIYNNSNVNNNTNNSIYNNNSSSFNNNKNSNNSNNNSFSSAFSFYNENNNNSKNDSKKDNKKESNSFETQQDFSKMKEKRNVDWGNSAKRKINRAKTDVKELFRSIINISGLIIFIALMVFVYFKFLRTDKYDQLSGLKFRVPATFKQVKKDSMSKTFESEKIGDECTIKISSGVVESDSYAEDYFRYVREMFAKGEEDVTFSHESLKINGNIWQSEKVIFLPKNQTDVSAEKIIPRYSYSLMFYNGSFFNVTYVNIKEDKDCDTNFKNFMNSLEFIDSNVN